LLNNRKSSGRGLIYEAAEGARGRPAARMENCQAVTDLGGGRAGRADLGTAADTEVCRNSREKNNTLLIAGIAMSLLSEMNPPEKRILQIQ
jgi:hypothetical protein